MASVAKILMVEPEAHSNVFLTANILISVFAASHVASWPYTLIYLGIHFLVFRTINNCIAAGRPYVPTKQLNNQTVIVTGAATGIGRATARELAKLHARVIVGIRGQQRAERVAQELSKESNGTVIGHHLDLGDLASVKAFAEKIDKVDILINNAGVTKKHEERTKDGLESVFGTNHIGHFYLTQLLLPLLIRSKGRIVNVSSIMHVFAKNNGDFTRTNSYHEINAYAESKLANILFTVELQKRFGDRGVKAYALHPGNVFTTEIGRGRSTLEKIVCSPFALSSRTIDQGATSTLFCALSDEAQPGKYHSNCRVTPASVAASDTKNAQELWESSEKIVDEKTKYL